MRAQLVTVGGRGNGRGAIALEFAFVLPLLVFLALICVDFGRFAYHHVAVANAARAGAEYAVTHPFTPATQAAWEAQVRLAAQNEMNDQTGYQVTDLAVEIHKLPDEDSPSPGNAGPPRIRVIATYSGFRTVVSWPGIPDAPTLEAAVEMPIIR